MRNKVLLWDIDGTILTSHGIGKRAFDKTFRSHFGHALDWDQIRFGGMTDLAIIQQAADVVGISVDEAQSAVFLKAYEEHFLDLYNQYEATLMKGISRVFDTLEGQAFRHGLLTGNIEAAAWRKVAVFGLKAYFSFGAFGNEDIRRERLAELAVERAERFLGQSRGDFDLYVIGDTIRDIQCGKHIGAKTIAVATGFDSRASLAEANPDLLLNDLDKDEARFFQFLADGPSL